MNTIASKIASTRESIKGLEQELHDLQIDSKIALQAQRIGEIQSRWKEAEIRVKLAKKMVRETSRKRDQAHVEVSLTAHCHLLNTSCTVVGASARETSQLQGTIESGENQGKATSSSMCRKACALLQREHGRG